MQVKEIIQILEKQGYWVNWDKTRDHLIHGDLSQSVNRIGVCWMATFQVIQEAHQKGIDFYNDVINELLKNGIEPFVDIYHWDMPQAIMEKGGFKNREMIQWFTDYARVLFESFGDRVKFWSTMNEPAVFCFSAYAHGTQIPLKRYLRMVSLPHTSLFCVITVL